MKLTKLPAAPLPDRRCRLVPAPARLGAGTASQLIRGVGRATHRKQTTMRNEQAARETKGVTVKLLAALDLGTEVEGMAGRQLRMRMVTIEPGGVFGPIHDHRDRPGMVYILQGTITDHRDGVAREYGPGAGWPEDKNTTHWLENRGTTPAVEISVDIVRQQ
jgi:quercetin dioxygenase-like cupin family protein